MPLKNVSRIKGTYMGHEVWRLIDKNGEFIDAFDQFSKLLINKHYSFSTRKRYSEGGARFIDYLFEVGVLGVVTTNLEINQAVAIYPLLLRNGQRIAHQDPKMETALREFARATGLGEGLSGKSFAPTLAAVNLLLYHAQNLAIEASAIARRHGIIADNDQDLLITAIEGLTSLSLFEKTRLKQNSILGAVMRLHGEIKRPRTLKSPVRNGKQTDLERLDFPLVDLPRLIEAATSYRDKALWLLLGASGVRGHESLNLLLEHIDVINRQVYVIDPHFSRFGRQMTKQEVLRFKGRVTSKTYLFEPLKSEFFKWYELYLRHEFVPTNLHSYVFQRLQGDARGTPLKDASDTAHINCFKRAVKRAGIKGPAIMPERVWTPHSLRHMYGVYMLNYIPVPGGFGLLAEEVQMLMGHKNINSTMHYARQADILLNAKLEAADRLIYDGGFDVNDFPQLIADRLTAEAEKFKLLVKK